LATGHVGAPGAGGDAYAVGDLRGGELLVCHTQQRTGLGLVPTGLALYTQGSNNSTATRVQVSAEQREPPRPVKSPAPQSLKAAHRGESP